jgi:DNA-binding SARP family transcriptional activator
MYADEQARNGLGGGAGRPEPVDRRVRFSVLGPLEARYGDTDHAPSTPKILQLLAMLVIRPGRTVSVDSLIGELWPRRVPRTARTTLASYVYHLRRRIDRDPALPAGESLVTTRAPGYALRIDPPQVDVHAFTTLLHRAHELHQGSDHSAAADTCRRALGLWSGPPLANVPRGPQLEAYTTGLLEELRAARHLLVEAEIAGGHHRRLVGELRSLTAENPFDEAMHAQLMVALGRSGRRSDALAVFRQLRDRLAAELGVEPCDELQLVQHDLLSHGKARHGLPHRPPAPR